MGLAFYWIPAMDPAAAAGELNRLIDSHSIVQVERKLVVQDNGTVGWAVCVEYLKASGATRSKSAAQPPRVDYREVLSPEDFAMYSALRALRKEEAERGRQPLYAYMSNDQMAEIARTKPSTMEELEKIEGLGRTRLRKFGQLILEFHGSEAAPRYMDDFVCWHDTRARLAKAVEAIQAFVREELQLELKPDWRIERSQEGLTWLGMRVFPQRVLLARRGRRRFAAKLDAYEDAVRRGRLSPPELQRRFDALVANTNQADDCRWRDRLMARRAPFEC